MSEKLSAIQEALEDAHSQSKRTGKWSTVPDVKQFETSTNLTNLRRLVKQGAASEKVVQGVPAKLFKPARAGAGMAPSSGLGLPGTDDRGKDPGKDPGKDRGGRDPFRPRRVKGHGKPRDDKKPRNDRKPRDDKKPDGRRHGKPSDEKPGKPDPRPRDGKKPNPRDAVQGTVGAGIATLLVGGLGGSMGGGGGMAAPRGGSISMPSM